MENIAAWKWTVKHRYVGSELSNLLAFMRLQAQPVKFILLHFVEIVVPFRVGLFSPSLPCKRTVVTDDQVQELSSLAPDCEPHRICVRFLTNRFEVSPHAW